MNISIIDKINVSKEIADNPYFYERDDVSIIFNNLSPMRSKALKAVPILHYFGVVTNLIAIIVLSQSKILKQKGIFFLLLLAYSDTMYNIMSILPDFLKSIQLVDYDIFTLSNFSCFFYDSRIILFHFYSVSLTLFATFDRFITIYKPLHTASNMDSTRSKMGIGIILFLICIVLALPHGFLFVYNEKEKNCDGNEFFKQTFYDTSFTRYEVFFMMIEPLVIWFIPGLLILSMNAYVIYACSRTIANNRRNAIIVGNLKNHRFLTGVNKIKSRQTLSLLSNRI
jgi:hypothetical protein